MTQQRTSWALILLLSFPLATLTTSCSLAQRGALIGATRSYQCGQYQEALRGIERAESYGEISPMDKPSVLLLKGICFEKQGQRDRALGIYQQIETQYPTNSMTFDAKSRKSMIQAIEKECQGVFSVPALFKIPNNVNFSTDHQRWKLGFAAMEQNGAILEFVPPNESVTNWTRIATIMYMCVPGVSVERSMQVSKELTLRQCPHTEWTILQSLPGDILFSWHHPTEGGEPAQYEIARLIQQQSGFYRLSFCIKNETPDKALTEEWASLLQAADVK